MTQSNTQTTSSTYSYANVRYVNDKIASDLSYLRERYSNLYSADQVETWKSDLYQWMYQGYADAVSIQFIRDGKIVNEVRWSIQDDGSITGDDNVGRLKLSNLAGTRNRILVTDSTKWKSLSAEAKDKFYKTLSSSWGPAEKIEYGDGSWSNDRQFSSGRFGVQRGTYGG